MLQQGGTINNFFILFATSAFYYVWYRLKYFGYRKPWLLPFLNNVILGYVCVGSHQFAEYLSLVTGNQIIYKLGLVASIFSMYFALRSLEVFLNENIHSRLSLVVILGVTIHLFISSLAFAEKSFYIQHGSIFIWAFAWMILFVYWHICAFWARKKFISDISVRTSIYYMLLCADASFLLSLAYSIFGYIRHSVNVCTDSHSIWCTFFASQALLLPIFLTIMPRAFHRPAKHRVLSAKIAFVALLSSILILLILLFTLPFFSCLTWKYVWP